MTEKLLNVFYLLFSTIYLGFTVTVRRISLHTSKCLCKLQKAEARIIKCSAADETAFLRLGDLGDPRERHELVKISYDNHPLRANKNTHLIKCKVNIDPRRTQNNS